MNKNIKIFFYTISIALIILRLLFIGNTLLIDDEAYYAMYARHLSWGYIDHGPVIGYLIYLFTIFGENSFTVRLSALTLLIILSVILYFFGKNHFNQNTGIIMSLGISANMLFHTNAVVVTPDVPLSFFTIIAIIYYYKAYFIDGKYFYIAGIFLGLAILSKVSALFPAIGIILFPFINSSKRYILSDLRFYFSFLITLILFMPFIIWNLQNDLAFVRYQGAHITEGGSLSDFTSLWAGICITAGPILFYYSIVKPFMMIRKIQSTKIETQYFIIVTIVPLCYFLVHSFFSRMEVNWPAPILSGGIFLFGICLGKDWPLFYKRFVFQITFSLFLILIVTMQTFFPFLPVKGKTDVTNRYHIYDILNTELIDYMDKSPDLKNYRFLAENYQIPSMINFYINPEHEATTLSINYHPTIYSFLYKDEEFKGRDFLFLKRGEDFPDYYEPYFESVYLLNTFYSKRDGKNIASYTLWKVRNYKGKDILQ